MEYGKTQDVKIEHEGVQTLVYVNGKKVERCTSVKFERSVGEQAVVTIEQRPDVAEINAKNILIKKESQESIKKLANYLFEDTEKAINGDCDAEKRVGFEVVALNALCNAERTLKNKCQSNN